MLVLRLGRFGMEVGVWDVDGSMGRGRGLVRKGFGCLIYVSLFLVHIFFGKNILMFVGCKYISLLCYTLNLNILTILSIILKHR